MKLRVSDLQSASDLESIRNSCDVFLQIPSLRVGEPKRFSLGFFMQGSRPVEGAVVVHGALE